MFNLNEELVYETIESKPSVTNMSDATSVKSSIMNTIDYLSGPFQKQAYQPLQFIVEGKVMKGDIQKVQEGIIWIDANDQITEIEIAKIEDILWRGQSFDKS